MEYNQIISLVPEGEHFDASAINEGVWISEAHLGNIESALQDAATNVAAALNEVNAATENLNTANAAVEAATTTIAERDTIIASLQEEIAALKAAPAGSIQQTTKQVDAEGSVETESEITREARRLREMRKKK